MKQLVSSDRQFLDLLLPKTRISLVGLKFGGNTRCYFELDEGSNESIMLSIVLEIIEKKRVVEFDYIAFKNEISYAVLGKVLDVRVPGPIVRNNGHLVALAELLRRQTEKLVFEDKSDGIHVELAVNTKNPQVSGISGVKFETIRELTQDPNDRISQILVKTAQ